MADDQQLELDPAPSPAAELKAFQNLDEKADQRAKDHELELRRIALEEMRAKMGPIGRLIGSTESSKTIAFMTVIVCLFFMMLVFWISYDRARGTYSDGVWNLLSTLASIVTGCVGFIFGTKEK